MKISLVGAELFRAYGLADMTKLTAAFRNFANAPKNQSSWFQFLRSLEKNVLITKSYFQPTNLIEKNPP